MPTEARVQTATGTRIEDIPITGPEVEAMTTHLGRIAAPVFIDRGGKRWHIVYFPAEVQDAGERE